MHIVTGETRNAVRIHLAGDEIVSLHPVLVCRAIGEMREGSITQFVIFQLPIITQLQSHIIAHRPVVVFSLDWIRQRASLRMTLDASVAGRDIIFAGGIYNRVARRSSDVLAAGSVANHFGALGAGSPSGVNLPTAIKICMSLSVKPSSLDVWITSSRAGRSFAAQVVIATCVSSSVIHQSDLGIGILQGALAGVRQRGSGRSAPAPRHRPCRPRDPNWF